MGVHAKLDSFLGAMSTDSNSRYTPETDVASGSSNNVSPVTSTNRPEGKSYSLEQSSITVKHYAQLLLEKDKRVSGRMFLGGSQLLI